MINLFKVFMADGVEISLKETLYSGFIGQGKKVEQFENLLKKRFNNDNILTVNSATSGLHLMLRLARDKVLVESPNISEGGIEVLTSPLTSIPTNWPILANGMKIKWVDVGMDCNMDLNDLKAKLSPTTRIILLIHWGGNPINLSEVKKIQSDCLYEWGYKPIVIQDCAHAIGSKLNNHWLSEWFPAVFSFQAIKHFTTGDGGCMTFMDQATYKQAKLLRWYGINRDSPLVAVRCMDDIRDWGYKFHMNDINATIGIHNFPWIDWVVSRNVDNSEYYNSQQIQGITKIEKHQQAYSSQWIHTIHAERREDFMRMMNEKGIMCNQVHARCDKNSCVEQFKIPLFGVERCTETQVCIPNHYGVTLEERECIVETMKKGW